MFAVQQMDYLPFARSKGAKMINVDIDSTTLELFSEEDPATRCEWFSALEGAIQAHDLSFDN